MSASRWLTWDPSRQPPAPQHRPSSRFTKPPIVLTASIFRKMRGSTLGRSLRPAPPCTCVPCRTGLPEPGCPVHDRKNCPDYDTILREAEIALRLEIAEGVVAAELDVDCCAGALDDGSIRVVPLESPKRPCWGTWTLKKRSDVYWIQASAWIPFEVVPLGASP